MCVFIYIPGTIYLVIGVPWNQARTLVSFYGKQRDLFSTIDLRFHGFILIQQNLQYAAFYLYNIQFVSSFLHEQILRKIYLLYHLVYVETTVARKVRPSAARSSSLMNSRWVEAVRLTKSAFLQELFIIILFPFDPFTHNSKVYHCPYFLGRP